VPDCGQHYAETTKPALVASGLLRAAVGEASRAAAAIGLVLPDVDGLQQRMA
jgi:hypothetical protein